MNLLLKNPVWSLEIAEAPYPPTGDSDILSQQRHKKPAICLRIMQLFY